MTAGIILAAGASSRMGRSKALLPHPISGESFITYLVNVFRSGGADPVLVVGRAEDTPLRDQAVAAGAIFVTNPDPSRGQLSSLLAGMERAEALGVGGLLVCPVDLPGITPAVVTRVLAASGTALIVRPTCQDRAGHPVYFSRALFPELHAADPSVGARAVVHADPSRVLAVPCDEPGILTDVDTPEDYERLRTGRSRA